MSGFLGGLSDELQKLLRPGPHGAGREGDGISEIASFGLNPGHLRLLACLPPDLLAGAPLVVVLHGCTQTAAGYARGAGWMELAQRHGFALLLPEQRRANNANLCFDWFEPGDITRGQGEAASIAAMTTHLIAAHGLDPRRVFVTGLSAGGAMAGVMLATYPELFAGGAIIAGLPYGCAADMQEAFDCMRRDRTRPAREWGDRVRSASPHRGPWPRVAVWHGGADSTVVPSNAREILKQWLDVHGLPAAASAEDRVDGYPHRIWRDAAGIGQVEAYAITGMDHGTPICANPADPAQGCGAAGPFILDVGISSSWRMAAEWGLLRPEAERRSVPHPARTPVSPPLRISSDPGAVIEKALRAAGLRRRP